MTKTFISFNCFYFCYRSLQGPKIASNLWQFGGRHQENCRFVTGTYHSKFGRFGTNYQHPVPRPRRNRLPSFERFKQKILMLKN